MALGNTQMILSERSQLREGEVEISDRAYNLIIGGMLLWGFLLNYAIVALFGAQVVRMVQGMNPLLFLALYFVLVLAGNALVVRSGPALSFVGYTMIAAPVGIVLCLSLQGIPLNTVKTAVLLTAIITLSFMIAATVYPGFFLRMGRVLMFALIALLIGELVSLVFLRNTGMAYTWLGAGLFSLFIGFDWARANTCAHTVNNAIDLSASLYLDIINLFLRILRILSRDRK